MDTQTLSQESQNQKWGFFSSLIWSIVVLFVSWGSGSLTLYIYAKVVYGGISMELINKARYDSLALPLCAFIGCINGSLILCGIIKLKKNPQLSI